MEAKHNNEEKILKEIGNKLRKLRKNKESSYEIFAFKNDLNRVTYGRIENGHDFRFSTFLKILAAHNISLSNFFDEKFDEK